MEIKPIAYIKTDFKEKFGIPRQSGRVKELKGTIIFEKEFNDKDFIRGIEEFSHLWLIFGFSKANKDKISPTVRPPRLGGNKRVGVFASRSPFRPNSLGLSAVKLLSVSYGERISLTVSGVDLLSDTPIYDIKPYLPYSDIKKSAKGSYGEREKKYRLKVKFPKILLKIIPKESQKAVIRCLEEDPRPSFHEDNERIYSMKFKDYDIHFKVNGKKLFVTGIDKK